VIAKVTWVAILQLYWCLFVVNSLGTDFVLYYF